MAEKGLTADGETNVQLNLRVSVLRLQELDIELKKLFDRLNIRVIKETN
jgi:hypothetical protein